MSELDYAYGAYASAGVVALVSVGGAYYGVITRTRSRVNFPLLYAGISAASAPLALGLGLSSYGLYKNAGKNVENLDAYYDKYNKEKEQYKKYMQQQAISGMVASVGVPFVVGGLTSLLNPDIPNNYRPALRYMVGAGSLIIFGGMSGLLTYYALAENELKKIS
jgi:hypothetical protein